MNKSRLAKRIKNPERLYIGQQIESENPSQNLLQISNNEDSLSNQYHLDVERFSKPVAKKIETISTQPVRSNKLISRIDEWSQHLECRIESKRVNCLSRGKQQRKKYASTSPVVVEKKALNLTRYVIVDCRRQNYPGKKIKNSLEMFQALIRKIKRNKNKALNQRNKKRPNTQSISKIDNQLYQTKGIRSSFSPDYLSESVRSTSYRSVNIGYRLKCSRTHNQLMY